jgi:LDH2 family malate/lactate/ureidoglycolate dehydrogenase
MPDVQAADLHRLASDLLCAVGTDPAAAQIIADSLVDANLAGHDSHGVLRLPAYLAGARQGHVDPAAVPRLLSRSGATAIVDAADGWGQPAMWLATKAAIECAREHGLGAAVVHRSYHIGRVAPYVESIAREGMIGQAMANAAPAVAPFGARGFPVPTGNIVDREGRPTTDPGDFYGGGALIPFGGHKGSGFSLLAQFIGRGLAQMDPSAYDGPRGVNGPFILAIDISRFTDLERFRAEVEAQCAAVTNCLPAEGVEAVLLPGQPELAMRALRERDGVPVADSTWRELEELARDHGVALPAEGVAQS